MLTPEQQQWRIEQNRADAHRAHDSNSQFANKANEAAVQGGVAALRGLLLINGGAAVALLAFVGGLASQSRIPLAALDHLSTSIVAFAFGVASAVLSLGLGYFVNYYIFEANSAREYHADRPFIRDNARSQKLFKVVGAFRYSTIYFAIMSLVAFLVGVTLIFGSIKSISRLATDNAVEVRPVQMEKAAPPTQAVPPPQVQEKK